MGVCCLSHRWLWLKRFYKTWEPRSVFDLLALLNECRQKYGRCRWMNGGLIPLSPDSLILRAVPRWILMSYVTTCQNLLAFGDVKMGSSWLKQRFHLRPLMVSKNSNCPKLIEALKLSRYCLFESATAWVALHQDTTMMSEVKAVKNCHYKLLNFHNICEQKDDYSKWPNLVTKSNISS